MSTITKDMLDPELKQFDEFLGNQDWVGAAQMIAVQLHSGQVDKQGAPYLGHLHRVARIAEGIMDVHMDRETVVAVALLHDSIEDTDVTYEELAEIFPSRVVDEVAILTRPDGVSYRGFIDQIALTRSPVAILVKLADLEDNTNPARGPIPPSLSKRYHLAKLRLEEALVDVSRGVYRDEWIIKEEEESNG